MCPVDKESCIEIGFFQKPHGVAGSVVLQIEPGFRDSVEACSVLFVELDGLLVPWFPIEDGVRLTSGKTAIVTLDWVSTEPQARKLCGNKVWIRALDVVPEDQAAEEAGWLGYRVYDTRKGYLGLVSEVNDYNGNLVLTVSDGPVSNLLPFHSDLVISEDHATKSLNLELPDGLLEI